MEDLLNIKSEEAPGTVFLDWNFSGFNEWKLNRKLIVVIEDHVPNEYEDSKTLYSFL